MRSRYLLIPLALVFLASCSSRKKQPEILDDPPEGEAAVQEMAIELKSVPTVRTTLAEGIPWSYQAATGPEHWSSLDPSFELCKTGLRQSPVNLVYQAPKEPREIIFDIRDSIWTLLDRQPFFVLQPGRVNTSYFMGTSFVLKEVTFHTPAEHTFSGKQAPLEVHLYHESENGETLIVSSVFQIGNTENLPVAQLLKQIPLADKKDFQVVEPIALGLLLPEVRSYYHYMGSLSYPPCTEGVHRVVFNTPLVLTTAQLAQLKTFLGDNSRPTQPLNKRSIENFPSPQSANTN